MAMRWLGWALAEKKEKELTQRAQRSQRTQRREEHFWNERAYNTADAAVSRRQGALPARPAALPPGRFLRTFLRRRDHCRARASDHSYLAQPRKGPAYSHVWRSVPRRGRLHRTPDPRRLQDRDL